MQKLLEGPEAPEGPLKVLFRFPSDRVLFRFLSDFFKRNFTLKN